MLFQVFIKMPTGRSVVVQIDECTKVEDLVPRRMSDVARCYVTYQGKVLCGSELCKDCLEPDGVITLRCVIAGGMFNDDDD